jgi:hypothetical protein
MESFVKKRINSAVFFLISSIVYIKFKTKFVNKIAVFQHVR